MWTWCGNPRRYKLAETRGVLRGLGFQVPRRNFISAGALLGVSGPMRSNLDVSCLSMLPKNRWQIATKMAACHMVYRLWPTVLQMLCTPAHIVIRAVPGHHIFVKADRSSQMLAEVCRRLRIFTKNGSRNAPWQGKVNAFTLLVKPNESLLIRGFALRSSDRYRKGLMKHCYFLWSLMFLFLIGPPRSGFLSHHDS